MHEILIVDDDPVAIEVIRDHLAGEGYMIHAVREWTGMNRILFARHVAVLILDVNLPGLKGNTLAQIVSKNLSRPPGIILYSGLPEEVLRRLTREVRATNFLSKGCSGEQVRHAVRAAALSFQRFEEALEAADTPPEPAREEPGSSSEIPSD